MSNAPGSGGPPAPHGHDREARLSGAVRRWRAWRLRWVSIAGVAVVLVAAIVAVTLTAGGGGTAGAKAHDSAAMGGMGGGGMAPMAGSMAPAGTFTTASGQSQALSSLRGRPAMVWLVTTWCGVCQVGTRAMASHLISRLARMHVRVIELQVYGDMGHASQGMTAFVSQYAGTGYHNPDWVLGTASSALTRAYDPKGQMDLYYLLDSTGHIRYVSSAPGTTGSQLLAHAAGLSR